METVFKMPFGKYKDMNINSRKIPTAYLRELEEDLLLKGANTSSPIMVALDKELTRRKR